MTPTPIRWPAQPVLEGTLAGSELSQLRDEWEAANERRREASQQQQAARNSASAAKAQDADAYAAARRAGKPDPGPVNENARLAREEDAARRFMGEKKLVLSIEGDVSRMLEDRRGDWLRDLEQQRAPAHAAAIETWEALAAQLDDLHRLDMARGWLARGRAKSQQPVAAGLRDAARQPYGMSRVVAELGEALRGWMREPADQLEVTELEEDLEEVTS